MAGLTPDERRQRNTEEDGRIDAREFRTRKLRNCLAGLLLTIVACLILFYFYQQRFTHHSNSMFFRAVPIGGH